MGKDLVDIRDVAVDKNLSKPERIAEYIRQIGDPYNFRCGKFTVTVKFTENGPTFEECLRHQRDAGPGTRISAN